MILSLYLVLHRRGKPTNQMNLRSETMKLLRHRGKASCWALSNDFLETASEEQGACTKVENRNYVRLKVCKTKRQ